MRIAKPVLARVDQWPARLNDAIELARGRPFEWGVQDCCLFAASVVLAITGKDPAEQYRGRYSDALGAARVAKRAGGLEAMIAKVCKRAGLLEVPIVRASRGDVVLADVGANATAAAGICLGSECAFTGPAGLVFLPLQSCRRAWHIA